MIFGIWLKKIVVPFLGYSFENYHATVILSWVFLVINMLLLLRINHPSVHIGLRCLHYDTKGFIDRRIILSPSKVSPLSTRRGSFNLLMSWRVREFTEINFFIFWYLIQSYSVSAITIVPEILHHSKELVCRVSFTNITSSN